MRRAVLAFSLIALLAACQQPANAPADKAAEPTATPAPVMPADAPPQEEAPAEAGAAATTPVSCRQEAGEAAAARLVQRCIQVSPATHPPCNAENPCQMIRDEIDRSCAMWTGDGDPPAECAA